MFDIASAVILGLVVVGLVSQVRSLIYGTKDDRIAVVACLVIAVVAVLVVAASDFGHEQVVLDRPLDSLNIWSQLVVALLVAGVASAAWQGVKAVRNIGANDNLPVPPPNV